MNNAEILKNSLMEMMESLLEIIAERRSQKFYKPINVHFVTNVIDEIEVSMIFLAVTFSCSYKGREPFPDPMNRNHLDLIRDRSCSMENLRYLLCCK